MLKSIPNLKQFYMKAILPELVLPRYGKIPSIRGKISKRKMKFDLIIIAFSGHLS